jgi:hypothetical protein
MKGYLYEKKKVERLIDDQDRTFIHHKKEIGSYKRIEGYTVNQSRIPKRQLCNKADVAEVIEKGADSLSKVDGLKSSAQILTEVGRIKRRRESEYQRIAPDMKEREDEKIVKTTDPTIMWLGSNLTVGKKYTGKEVRKLVYERMAGNIVFPFVLVGSRVQFCNQPSTGKYQVDDLIIEISQPGSKKSTLYFEVLN